MKNILKNILVAGIIGLVVGVAIAAFAPAIAAAAGMESAGVMGNAVFMGLFAGAWGALGAVATPAITYAASALFGPKPSASHDIAASLPVHTVSEAQTMDTPCHCERLEQKRAHEVPGRNL